MSDTIQYKPMTGLNETSFNKIIEMSGKDLATKEDVNKAVSNVTVDTSNLATKSELRLKVDKEEGKGLSTEDFTTEYKNKLEGLSNSGVSDEQISAAVEKYLQDNPVSVDTSNLATKSEVNNKVDKVAGKGLSTNDYTTSEKTKLAGLSNYDDTEIRSKITQLQEDVNNKVDKVTGKGLSSNDYTTLEKNKLAGLSNYDDTEIRSKITQLQEDVNNGVSQDTINTAVENYLQNNPIQSGATAEQAAQIQANKTAIGDENSGLIKEVNNIKNTELQNLNKSIQTLETLVGDKNGLPSGDANIIASINRIDSKATGTNVDLSEYQKKSDSNLNTTDKNIVGAINEIKTSLSNLVIESGNLNLIDYTFGCTLKLKEIKPIYGNVIVNKTSIIGNEGGSDSFTVKLDSAPNVNQSVKIHCADAYVNVSPQDLIFTPTNYSTEQTITVNILENPSYEDWIADIKVMGNNVETKTITVNVTNTTEAPIEITSIQLDKTVLNLKDGETAILTPTIEPSNASSGYNWKSSANNIATVDNGTVRGIAQGSAVITCYSTTNENIKAECNVSVTETAIESITLPEVATVNRNRSITLTPTIVPSGLTTYAWSIDNENASINNGVVTGVTAGTSIVTCYSTKNNSIKDTTTVTIEELPIESITLDSETVSVTQGKTVTLTPTITPSDATVGYTWSVNNENATVVDGVVTGVNIGSAIVTCTSNANSNIKASCEITINENVVKVIDNVAIKDDSLYFVFDTRDGSNEERTMSLEDRVKHETPVAEFVIEGGTMNFNDITGFSNNGLRYQYSNIAGVASQTTLKIRNIVGLGSGHENTATYKQCTFSFGYNSVDIVPPDSPYNSQFIKRGGGYGIGLCNKEDGLYWAKAHNDAGSQERIRDTLIGKTFITFRWNGTGVDIFINATLLKTVPYASTQNNGAFFNSWNFFSQDNPSPKGLFAQIQLATCHTRALTDDEIMQNYNAYMGV